MRFQLFLAGFTLLAISGCESPQSTIDKTTTASIKPAILGGGASAALSNTTEPTPIAGSAVQPENQAVLNDLPGDEEKPESANPDNEGAAQSTDDKPKKTAAITYVINGVAKDVTHIGYGMPILSRKLPNARHISYLTPAEGTSAVAPRILREVVAGHKKDPNIKVSLVGIGYGANLVTQIASKLNKRGIDVHYLGTIEGSSLKPVLANVKNADNFNCSNLDCKGVKSSVASGNAATKFSEFSYDAGNIPISNNPKLHARIVRQINS